MTVYILVRIMLVSAQLNNTGFLGDMDTDNFLVVFTMENVLMYYQFIEDMCVCVCMCLWVC